MRVKFTIGTVIQDIDRLQDEWLSMPESMRRAIDKKMRKAGKTALR